MKVALFATCIADAMFPQAPQATMHLLQRLGVEVDFPQSQACCGQMHVNTGYYPEAMPLIKNHVKTFEPVLDGEWDAIVVPSGSCTGSIREQQEMVATKLGDDALATKASAIAKKTYELSEFLIDVMGIDDVGAYFAHRVTYHPTCHSLRVAKVGDKPLQLLRKVEGMELVDLPSAESCCGFGGTFALKNHETSASMLTDKMNNIIATKADVLVAGDYSCLMNIAGGLSRNRAGIRAMHLAEVLAGTKNEPWMAPESTTKAGV
ncbi:(Fe-S)-binding protein [Arcanobacterium pinnipediorum]|uniref:(Fe-S)-binding protein n=1 Tax=Arcanobacterium pinnipediorum TaxID=1503041 RepID=A0ABY5AH70_9ACTO|nr:(Fe-S)-binding protein [Arcanobacterium pinnipediorum]USR79432.1 (Fe-S)-binding protein [Arcanobacterium pinnipediorum]